MLEGFEDGAFFVNLAPITDPDLVTPAIARTIGLRETAGQSLRDSLVEYLSEKQILLLFDNFEQVVAAAGVIADLLAEALSLKVLVTSREVLHLRGEKEFPVPPLALPDLHRLPPLELLVQFEAVALFVQRALDARPDFELTAENAPVVAE